MCGNLTKTKLGITDTNNGEEPYASILNRALLMALLRRAAHEVEGYKDSHDVIHLEHVT